MMEKSFRNKNYLVVFLEVFIIILGIAGITFATSKLLNNRTTTVLTAGEYNVDYKGDSEIVINGLEPISDDDININTKDNVIRLEFSLRGVSTNEVDDIIYDVMLTDMNVDCSLLNKYTKWNLYRNGNLLSSGSLDPAFDGNILDDNYRLTTIQEDLPDFDESYDNYVLLFWISESCDDLESCELIDQSDIIDSSMSMKVFIALYEGAKTKYTRIANYDTACANKPILSDNMVAITYYNGNYVVADNNNSNKTYKWYDYGNSQWANMVVVNNSSKYSVIGTKIDDDDVLGYFVWIPRYSYKLWNATNEVVDSYNAYDNGIDIKFQGGLSSKTLDTYENDKYLTHLAYQDNLKGFWISKYEISNVDDNYYFKSNMNVYRNDLLENYKTIGTNIASLYKISNEFDSHLVNNLEWGATLYLSHSKYGVCEENGCSSISLNDSYISGANKQDTTTRNVYGVYDMAGSASEYVLGNNTIGSATNEVILSDGDTWYHGHGILSDRDYLVRGGANTGLFYYGDIGTNLTELSSRVVLVSK